MTHEEQWARLDGQIAALRGVGARTNPHVLGSEVHRAWSGGWREVSRAGRTCECGAPIREANKTGRCHLCAVRRANNTRALPSDFAEIAPGKTNDELAEHYHCSTDLITRFRKESGVASAHSRRESPELPADFHLVAPTLTRKQLRERYHRADPTITRWLSEAGVQHARYVPTPPVKIAPPKPVTAPADIARALQAAAYLGRFGPVSRCNEAGRYDPRGHYWRRGSAILCASEVIARASRQGFNPDAWREVRAA